MFLLVIAIFIVLIVLRVRLAFALLLASIVYFIVAGIPLDLVAQRVVATTQSFPLLAIPLFILAGNLMNATGMTMRLFRLAEVLLGRVHGGLGHVVVAVGMIMAGTSGSAIADAAALSRVAIDEMERLGYPRAFSASICAFAATMGPLIPPSIMFIVYGWLANVSINKLFLAGAIPGVLVGVFLFVTIYVIAKRRNFRVAQERPTVRDIVSAFKEAIWAAAMPVVILGGIVIGAFTATEAAAVAVGYALLVGVLIFRTIRLPHIIVAIQETVRTATSIMFVVAAAYPFGWIITAEQVPQHLLEAATSVTSSPLVVLMIVNLVLFLLGMVMESTAILLIVVPALVPLMTAMGIDLVHFGVIVTANLLLGTITPPFGILMFTTCAVSRVKVLDFQRASIPFYAAFVVLIILITYIPWLSLWLPSVLL